MAPAVAPASTSDVTAAAAGAGFDQPYGKNFLDIQLLSKAPI